MIAGIQILGAVFGLAMSYFTFLFYRRGDYPKTDFVFWMIIWIIFLGLVLFPEAARYFLNPLGVMDLMNLFMITAFMATFALLFYQHDFMRKNEKKIRAIVREEALNNPKKKGDL